MAFRHKKSYGQHFLNNEEICSEIAGFIPVLSSQNGVKPTVVEVGPGRGAISIHLRKRKDIDFKVIELDERLLGYLQGSVGLERGQIIIGDFLKMDLSKLIPKPGILIGNFPYNISSQIVFHALDYKSHIAMIIGMFQMEVARRICGEPGNKHYGILSVLIQTWYDAELLLDIGPENFDPPPRVQSGVIRLKRNERQDLDCDERLFKRIVKAAFNQRRKKLRNALSAIDPGKSLEAAVFDKRAERLSVEDYIELTKFFES